VNDQRSCSAPAGSSADGWSNEHATQWALRARAWVLLERCLLPEALDAAAEIVSIAERLDDSALAT